MDFEDFVSLTLVKDVHASSDRVGPVGSFSVPEEGLVMMS